MCTKKEEKKSCAKGQSSEEEEAVGEFAVRFKHYY